VIAISLISCITYLVASDSAVTVFFWFVSLTTIALILTYTGMLWTFLGWYRAVTVQGLDRDSLSYKSPFAPYPAWLALSVGCIVMLFIGFDVFVPWSTEGFVTSYFGLVFGVIMFVFWKVFKRTKWTNPRTCDIYSGKAEIDEECEQWEDGGLEENERMRLAQMNFARRTWERIW